MRTSFYTNYSTNTWFRTSRRLEGVFPKKCYILAGEKHQKGGEGRGDYGGGKRRKADRCTCPAAIGPVGYKKSCGRRKQAQAEPNHHFMGLSCSASPWIVDVPSYRGGISLRPVSGLSRRAWTVNSPGCWPLLHQYRIALVLRQPYESTISTAHRGNAHTGYRRSAGRSGSPVRVIRQAARYIGLGFGCQSRTIDTLPPRSHTPALSGEHLRRVSPLRRYRLSHFANAIPRSLAEVTERAQRVSGNSGACALIPANDSAIACGISNLSDRLH